MAEDPNKSPLVLHRASSTEWSERMIAQSQTVIDDAQKVLKRSRQLVEISRRLRGALPKG